MAVNGMKTCYLCKRAVPIVWSTMVRLPIGIMHLTLAMPNQEVVVRVGGVLI